MLCSQLHLTQAQVNLQPKQSLANLQVTQSSPKVAEPSTALKTSKQVMTFQRDFWSKGLIW